MIKSPKLRFQPVQFLMRVLFLVCRLLPSVPSTGEDTEQALVSLLIRVLAPLHGSLTLMTSFNFITSSIGPTVTLEVRVSMQEFGGRGWDTIWSVTPPRLIRTDITISGNKVSFAPSRTRETVPHWEQGLLSFYDCCYFKTTASLWLLPL